MTAAAEWLNSTFYTFDYNFASAFHSLHESSGSFFDVFFKAVTVLGDGGIFFIVLSLCLILFKKTRKIGLSMLFAVAVGAVFTNLCLKTTIARPRPYVDETSDFFSWWVSVGSKLESEYSFPSGHSTASFAAMTGFFIAGNKKYSWTGYILAILIALSRVYLMVHYASDITAGLIVGVIAGIIAGLLIKILYDKSSGKFNDFLNNSSIVNLFKKNKENEKIG